MSKHICRKEEAFTLIETAIVILVIGLFLTPLLIAGRIYLQNKALLTTENNINEVQMALQEYLTANGFLPCPAPLNLPHTDPNYALAVTCDGTAAAGTFVVDDGRGDVRTGAVPARTLANLAIPYMRDGYGTLITYSVTESLTSLAGGPYDPLNGAISIQDEAGNELSVQVPVPAPVGGTAPFVLISSGRDGKGAYTKDGVLMLPCGNTSVDDENCDLNADAVFVAQSGFAMTGFPGDPNHYDDRVQYTLNTSTLTAECPDGQVLQSITAGQPTCVNNTEDVSCPAGQVLESITGGIGGPTEACVDKTNDINCPDGEFLTGISAGAPVCAAPPAGDVCGAKGMIHNPSDPKADADGCVGRPLNCVTRTASDGSGRNARWLTASVSCLGGEIVNSSSCAINRRGADKSLLGLTLTCTSNSSVSRGKLTANIECCR